jgi:hypothetical protein
VAAAPVAGTVNLAYATAVVTVRRSVDLGLARRARARARWRAIALLSAGCPALLLACSDPERLGRSNGPNRPGDGAGGGGRPSLPGFGGSPPAGSGAVDGQSTGGDAAVPDAGGGGSDAAVVLSDAGIADSGAPADAATDSGRSCAGLLQDDVCWYLSGDGQSCNQACQARGGFDAASLLSIGVPAQGGSVERCSAVLTALLDDAAGAIEMGTRVDVGVGCHLFGEELERWWLTAPPFDPGASAPGIQVACGCNE